MALVTWRDVVSGTTRKVISFIFAGIKCENCVVVVQKKKLCLTGASLPIVVTSRTRREIFQCIGFRFTAIQGQKHRNGRKRWVDWVKRKRAKWEPSVHSYLCSVHFKAEEFMFQFGNEVDLSNKWLQRDELGVCVFPSIHSGAKEKPISARDKRMVR